MQRWLLMSNCQTFALANSMMLANAALDVTGVDIWTYKADPARHHADMATYDRLIVHPDVAALPGFDMSGASHVNYLPSVEFGAYHPDTAYVWVDGVYVEGPTATYHSMLALAAYEAGLSLDDARALFNGATYAACGYMADWVPQRDLLVQAFRNHGIDIADLIPRWARGRPFMYSVNHPRMDPVYDVACRFLTTLGLDVTETGLRPSDTFVYGPCLPVFPEIAETLGVAGSTSFKNGGYRCLSLDAFLAGSFAAYAAHPRGAVRPHPIYQPRYEHVLTVVKGRA